MVTGLVIDSPIANESLVINEQRVLVIRTCCIHDDHSPLPFVLPSTRFESDNTSNTNLRIPTGIPEVRGDEIESNRTLLGLSKVASKRIVNNAPG
jgi:hypothetical protein